MSPKMVNPRDIAGNAKKKKRSAGMLKTEKPGEDIALCCCRDEES